MNTTNQQHWSGPSGCADGCPACGEVKVARHTPGPWVMAPSSNPRNGTNWRDIRSMGGHFSPSYVGEAMECDARLIAAAPDLLAALTELLSWSENQAAAGCRDIAPHVAARAALALATGGAK